MASADELRYIETSKRALSATNFGAIAIILAIIVSCAGDWETLAIAIVLHVVAFPLNLLLNKLIPRFGSRVEVFRALMNTSICVVGYPLIGWPLTVWLWLPFQALTAPVYSTRHNLYSLIIHVVVQSTSALICGVAWIYPVTFLLLTVVCHRLAEARIGIIRDMLADAERQRDELRQAQKLEAVGRLAAGVAHEINTPMQFVGNSLDFVQEGVEDLLQLAASVDAEHAGDIDIDYLRVHLPVAMALANDGVKRVSSIVASMKQFVHPATAANGPVDLDDAIRSTLTISKHEYKLVADVDLQLGKPADIQCNAGEVGQVLLNIIVNAAHAIADRVHDTSDRGTITVRTSTEGAWAVVEVGDTGCGISPDVRDRIFDPFFTTKDVGRGSGQGLAISKAIVERHGGRLTFDTEPGRGTNFKICLPFALPVHASA